MADKAYFITSNNKGKIGTLHNDRGVNSLRQSNP